MHLEEIRAKALKTAIALQVQEAMKKEQLTYEIHNNFNYFSPTPPKKQDMFFNIDNNN